MIRRCPRNITNQPSGSLRGCLFFFFCTLSFSQVLPTQDGLASIESLAADPPWRRYAPIPSRSPCRLVRSPVVYTAGAAFLQLGEDLRALGFALDMCRSTKHLQSWFHEQPGPRPSGFQASKHPMSHLLSCRRYMNQDTHISRGTNAAKPRGIYSHPGVCSTQKGRSSLCGL